MDQPVPLPGGHLEYAVLAALWEGSRLTARQVHERVGVPMDLAFTTITRVIDRLCAKGLIDRRRRDNVFVYRPLVTRATVDRVRLSRTLGEMLGGDQQPALASLVDAIAEIDPALLDELVRLVAARRGER